MHLYLIVPANHGSGALGISPRLSLGLISFWRDLSIPELFSRKPEAMTARLYYSRPVPGRRGQLLMESIL
jgi:hypothetical protein